MLPPDAPFMEASDISHGYNMPVKATYMWDQTLEEKRTTTKSDGV
jgi:hypothetical protein